MRDLCAGRILRSILSILRSRTYIEKILGSVSVREEKKAQLGRGRSKAITTWALWSSKAGIALRSYTKLGKGGPL